MLRLLSLNSRGKFVLKRLTRTCVGLMILVAQAANADDGPSSDAIKAAVAKSLPLLEKGAKGSIEQRKQCFNCHNQGLPIMALTTARSRGFEIDTEHLQTQLDRTLRPLFQQRQRFGDRCFDRIGTRPVVRVGCLSNQDHQADAGL